MTTLRYNGYMDTNEDAHGYKDYDGKPQLQNMSYENDIGRGVTLESIPWSKSGITSAITASVRTDLWAPGITIQYPVSGTKLYARSDSADDYGIYHFSGSMTSGSTNSITDTTKNFTLGNPVVQGDIVLLDDLGSYGYVTSASTTTLTVDCGFSYGISASGSYRVVSRASGSANGQIVRITGLDSNYNEITNFLILSGTNSVSSSIEFYRVNSFRFVGTGTNGYPTGNIRLGDNGYSKTFSYIVANTNRANNIAYTVPAGKTLYINEFLVGYTYDSIPSDNNAIFTTMATQDSLGGNRTLNLFYGYTDVLLSNNTHDIRLPIPTRLKQKVDIKVSAIATKDGTLSCTLRGWLETND